MHILYFTSWRDKNIYILCVTISSWQLTEAKINLSDGKKAKKDTILDKL
ncbi:MAG: hypothetical protein ACI9XC_000120 [Gammaproteobacteria bacterium]|jgi:hypothetical protein